MENDYDVCFSGDSIIEARGRNLDYDSFFLTAILGVSISFSSIFLDKALNEY